MGYRIIGRWTVADTNKDGCFFRSQITCMFSKVIQTGSFYTIALVAIEIGIAVKLHNVCFGVFFLNLRCKKNLNDLSCKGTLLGKICIFDHLLGNGTASLGHMAAVLDQGETGAEGCYPVYTAMTLKAAVLLGNIAVLQVHADLTDIHILIMACINKPDLFSVLIINEGIREHGKIGPFHLRQFVIGDLTAFIQLRLCFCIDQKADDRHDNKTGSDHRQYAMKEPANNPEAGCNGVTGSMVHFFRCLLV